jgi:hypothetical protein
MPEVDRESPVGKVKPQDSPWREHASMFPEKTNPFGVAVFEDCQRVAASTDLSHSNVFEHSRTQDGVEEMIAERQPQRIRAREAVGSDPLAPLPLAECREIDAPGFDSGLRQHIHGKTVSASAIENARSAAEIRTFPLQQRKVVVADACQGSRGLTVQTLDLRWGEILARREVVVVVAIGKIDDA